MILEKAEELAKQSEQIKKQSEAILKGVNEFCELANNLAVIPYKEQIAVLEKAKEELANDKV